MGRVIIILSVLLFPVTIMGQPLNGATGLMNIPSAEMQPDGTVMAGANYLPNELTPVTFDYNTGNYYFNITFLPFFAFSYRMTLLKMPTGNFNQDRSFGLKLRLLREKKYIPALVIGGNDLYSSSGKTSTYFNTIFAVATKNIQLGRNNLGITAGYANEGFGKYTKGNMKGLFAGAAFSPGFYPPLRIMGEYDSNVFNVGASVLLFRHLFLFGLLHNLKTPAGGFAVQFSLF